MKFNFKKHGLRSFIGLAASVAVIVLVVVGVTSCNRISLFQLALDNISESRFYLKQDQTDNIRVQFSSGMREEVYVRDGISGRTTAFGLVSVEPLTNVFGDAIELQATLRINGENLAITLERNQFGRNFGHDIERLVCVSAQVSLALTVGTQTIVFNLTNTMTDNCINWERALEIAVDHLAGKIRNAGRFEVYVRIIADLVRGSGSYWFIQFVPEKSAPFFAVISSSGEIIR